MPKAPASLELTFQARPPGSTISGWLHLELCRAIFDGRLKPGARLPASRDFARQYNLSRGTVVGVFEQLQSDGYLRSRLGSGTFVNERLPQRKRPKPGSRHLARVMPPPLSGLAFPQPARPFRTHEPALDHFPVEIWARLASRRMRGMSTRLLAGRDPLGFKPLREAIADYLGMFRGVICAPQQILIVSGVQQALAMLTRLLTKPGEPVWMEDPGYFGATAAIRAAGARMVAVPVDDKGIVVSRGIDLEQRAKLAYVTPAHQFPLGSTMALERRLELISWAANAGAYVLEDDYDSEYRFDGQAVPALQSLDDHGRVILLGSFSKLLFPALRIGYAVLPPSLVDPVIADRFWLDQYSFGLEQAFLRDFIVEGHLGRHIRRMRELYGGRLLALRGACNKYLGGLLDIPPIPAGLCTAGLLAPGLGSWAVERAASAAGVESMGLHRFCLARSDVQGLLLGFAAFSERQIELAVTKLTGSLERLLAGTDGQLVHPLPK